MLKIRSEQMVVLEQGAVAKRLEHLMRRAWPEACGHLDARDVQKRIKTGLQECRRLGIEDFENILRYHHLMFQFGTDSLVDDPDIPWAAVITGWADADEYMKLAALEKRARKELLDP